MLSKNNRVEFFHKFDIIFVSVFFSLKLSMKELKLLYCPIEFIFVICLDLDEGTNLGHFKCTCRSALDHFWHQCGFPGGLTMPTFFIVIEHH